MKKKERKEVDLVSIGNVGLPWDKPVDESLWNKVEDYCINDVIATEAAFKHLSNAPYENPPFEGPYMKGEKK